jgi:hypothetical protein
MEIDLHQNIETEEVENEPEEETAEQNKPQASVEDYKEFITLETGSIKLSLGSSTRPIEYLAGLLLDLKTKLNDGEKEKPNYC